MNTRQNRCKVLAQFLRAAMNQIGGADTFSHRGSTIVPTDIFKSALQSIEAVAEELEADAARPNAPAAPLTNAERHGLDAASRAAEPL